MHSYTIFKNATGAAHKNDSVASMKRYCDLQNSMNCVKYNSVLTNIKVHVTSAAFSLFLLGFKGASVRSTGCYQKKR